MDLKNGLFLILILLLTTCSKEKIELNWTEINVSTTFPLEDVYFFDQDTGILVGGIRYQKGVVLTTNDGGTTWAIDSLLPGSLYNIDVIDRSTIYAVGHFGKWVQSYDGGNSWSNRRFPQHQAYWSIDYINHETGIGVGGGGYHTGAMYLSNVNQGNRDLYIDSLLHEMNDALFIDPSSNPSLLIAVGFGAIMRSEDGGQNWTLLPENGDNFRAVHFPSPQIGYVVGASGKILKTSDGGLTWERQNRADNFTQNKTQFNDVLFVDNDKGYAVGNNSTFWKTIDGGENWLVIENFPAVSFNSIFIRDGQGYLVSKEGRLFTFVD